MQVFVPGSHVPVCPPDIVGHPALVQHPVEAMQRLDAAHFWGSALPQVKPQFVPSQVAVPPVGAAQALQEEPQVAGLLLLAQLFPQVW